MTETQKRWLATVSAASFGLLTATDLHLNWILRLPLWNWGVVVLLAILAYTSWLWLRPGRWHTNKVRYGLAYGSYFGLFMFLFGLLLRPNNNPSGYVPMNGNALFIGLFCGLFMGLMIGVSYNSRSIERNSHGP
ncbi:hypothetical protein [Deinococcus sp.]|uniref:hypothetical protein n=1 Tax=Deinococcus sp. TaxID=47478 RepID=UPI003C7D818D